MIDTVAEVTAVALTLSEASVMHLTNPHPHPHPNPRLKPNPNQASVMHLTALGIAAA